MNDWHLISFKQRVVNTIELLLSHYSDYRQITEPITIPVQRVENETGLLYVSAIAPKLASHLSSSAETIASELIEIADDYSLQLEHFSIALQPPAWLYIHSDRQIMGFWLETMLHSEKLSLPPVPIIKDFLPSTPEILFKIQYIYARCHSLLALAARENLLLSKNINWLNLEHHVEIRLLIQLTGLIDDYISGVKPKWLQFIDSFTAFESKCRIFGDIKTENPQLAQTRLGLMAVAIAVLKILLQNTSLPLVTSL